MEAEAIVTVSAAVVTLVTLLKWAGVPAQFGPVAVLGASIVGVALWGYSSDTPFDQTQLFSYFSGLLAVMTSAAGIYGFTRATGDSLTTFKGTGDGGRV